MIDHISIGVRDVAASGRFYDAALGALGYRRLSDSADSVGYGDTAAVYWIGASKHPVPPDPESGFHICFTAASRTAVDKFHAAALAAGGRDNGKPGVRSVYGPSYYAAFVVDPDGYRIEAYCGAAP